MFNCNDVGLVPSTEPVNINFTNDLTKQLTKETFDEDNKAFIFGQRVRRLQTIANHLEAENNIILSKWNENHKGINNVDLIDDIVEDGLFQEAIVLSPMAHNVGLNIRENIKVIGLAGLHTDIDIFQSVNRARKQSVNLVVEKLRKRDLERSINKNNKELELIELFKQGNLYELNQQIDINACKWTYDVYSEKTDEYVKQLNSLYEAHLIYENCILNFIITYGEFEYYKKLFPKAKQIHCMDAEYFEQQRQKNLAREGQNNKLVLYVIDYLFKTLNKGQQESFRKRFHQFDGFGRKDRLPGLKVTNKRIEPLGFTVINEQVGSNQETVWKIKYK
ncbi:hypothetical protein HXA34_11245 [Salipaludibacillus agaradhaerens]|jgi:hypothetical protein|nr:hypothetical protein [Salipaludibacillus agaradhaerens]